MPLPLVPLIAGKLVVAGGIALYGHRLARRLQRPSDYSSLEPAFAPETHLEGLWKGEGVLQGPFGKVGARVAGTAMGEWFDGHGRLEVAIHADNGAAWRESLVLARDEARLTLADGTGTGEWAGNSLHVSRTMTLPEAMGGWVLHSDDWFHVLPSGAMAHRASWSKWGWPVADLSMQWTRTV
jgi:Protein of unknown function (DUF3833)